MSFPTPPEKCEDVTERALLKVQYDEQQRERRRRELARETGYRMFMPGMF